MNKVLKNKLIILMLLIFVFAGCSSDKISKAPENFNKDLWVDSVELHSILKGQFEKKKELTENQQKTLKEYQDKYYSNPQKNDAERFVIETLASLNTLPLSVDMYAIYNNKDKFNEEEANKYKKKCQDWFDQIEQILNIE